MRNFLPLLVALSLAFVGSCDKPLVLEQEDNVSAITLSTQNVGGLTTLTWTPIDHAGFNKYWVVRVPDEELLVSDSLQFFDMQVLFTSTDPLITSFEDSRPVLSDGNYYQVFAEVNGRFVQSNAVLGSRVTYKIEGLLTFGLITGANGQIYFISRDQQTGKQSLNRYDINTRTIEKSFELANGISSRSKLLYGDFGTGSPEILLSLNGTQFLFFDAQTLDENFDTSLSLLSESLLLLPDKRIGVLSSFGSTLSTYSRATNTWTSPKSLTGGTVSSNSMMKMIEGKDEFVIMITSTTIYNIAYQGGGVFTELRRGDPPTPTSFFTGLAIDPQGEYIIPSRFGEMIRINDFQLETKLSGDSTTNSGNRIWDFTSRGRQILLISNAFPQRIFMYDRSSFKLNYSETLSQLFFAEGFVKVDDINYLVIRKNETPFQIILSPLPD